MLRLLARLLVRWRWPFIALWVVLGSIGVIQAPKTQHILNLRGGSRQPTE